MFYSKIGFEKIIIGLIVPEFRQKTNLILWRNSFLK